MSLTEIAAGASVFIDANIFVYHFGGRSEECSSLLDRVQRGEVQGFAGPAGLLEVAHRLMMLEAAEQMNALGSNPASRLARQPEAVRRLSKYYFSVAGIYRMGVQVLALPQDFIAASQEFRQSHGLLVNDSLVPMHMREAGLSFLASADQAFDAIPSIRRFAPSDV